MMLTLLNHGRRHMTFSRYVAAVTAGLGALLVGGCATAWEPHGSYYRTEQTRLAIRSTPPGQVSVNNKVVGTTPATIALQYGREVAMRSRKVAYYRSQPGWALFLTGVTFGFYIPFGCIPLDVQTELQPLDAFKENVYAIEIRADGCEPWKQQVVCTGEESQSSNAILSKK